MILLPGGQNVEGPVAHPIGMEVFDDFPEITAIGRDVLQEHCNEWLKTSIARQSRINLLTIDRAGSKLVIADVGILNPPDIQAGEILHFPLDYLLNYLIERIAPPDQQNRLKNLVAMKRFGGGPAVYQQFKVSPRKPLGIKCKNPECGALLKTQLMGYAGQPLMSDIEPLICPTVRRQLPPMNQGISSSFRIMAARQANRRRHRSKCRVSHTAIEPPGRRRGYASRGRHRICSKSHAKRPRDPTRRRAGAERESGIGLRPRLRLPVSGERIFFSPEPLFISSLFRWRKKTEPMQSDRGLRWIPAIDID